MSIQDERRRETLMIRTRPFLWQITNTEGAKTEEFRGTHLEMINHVRKLYGTIAEIIGPTGESPGLFKFKCSLKGIASVVQVQRQPWKPKVHQPVHKPLREAGGRQW